MGHIILKGKSSAMELYIIFTSNLRREISSTVSGVEFLCPFGRKEADVRKSSDRKVERFEFTPVDHTHR